MALTRSRIEDMENAHISTKQIALIPGWELHLGVPTPQLKFNHHGPNKIGWIIIIFFM